MTLAQRRKLLPADVFSLPQGCLAGEPEIKIWHEHWTGISTAAELKSVIMSTSKSLRSLSSRQRVPRKQRIERRAWKHLSPFKMYDVIVISSSKHEASKMMRCEGKIVGKLPARIAGRVFNLLGHALSPVVLALDLTTSFIQFQQKISDL